MLNKLLLAVVSIGALGMGADCQAQSERSPSVNKEEVVPETPDESASPGEPAIGVGRFLDREPDGPDGLPILKVPSELTCLAKDRNGVIWMGSRYLGIVRYDGKQFRLFDAYNSEIPDSGIRSLVVDRDNVKWFCSSRGLVFSYDEQRAPDKRWQTTPPGDSISKKLALGLIPLCRIRQHPDGTIWILAEYGGFFRVQSEKLARVPWETFPREEANAFDIDQNGTFWLATREGVFHSKGEEWKPLELAGYGDVRSLPIVWDIWCNPKDKAVYFVSNSGLHRLHHGKGEILLPDRMTVISGNDKGQFVVGYGSYSKGVSFFDGTRWRHWGDGTPAKGIWLTDAVIDDGHVWLVSRSGDLLHFDGQKLTREAPRFEAPDIHSVVYRLPWRQRSWKDLVNAPVTEAGIQEVLAAPRRFVGKKVRIVGRITSSFEFADIVGADGKRLYVWPESHPGCYHFLKESGWQKKLEGAKEKEYLGYVTFGGYYGHMGGWRYLFTVVEIYPHGKEAAEKGLTKDAAQRAMNEYIDSRQHDSAIAVLPDSPARRRVREQLQGKWDLVRFEKEAVGQGLPKPVSLIVQWDRLTWQHEHGEVGLRFRIDSERRVPAIDLLRFDPNHHRHFRGIYRLEKDLLTLFFTDLDRGRGRGPRPQDSAIRKDAPGILYVFRKDPGFSVNLDRSQIVPDDPNAVAALSEQRADLSFDAFGRVYEVQLQPRVRVPVGPPGFLQSIADSPQPDILKPLDGLANLQSLSLWGCATDANLQRISRIETLKTVVLGSSPVTDDGLEKLAALKDLRYLCTGSPRVTGAALQKLSELGALRGLNLRDTSLTNENMKFLPSFESLTTLHLPRSVSDEGLRHLREMRQMRHLELPGSISDAGLGHLRELNQLEQLVLPLSISDAGMHEFDLSSKICLKDLRFRADKYMGMSPLPDSQISDKGLVGIEKLVQLETLHLGKTTVTDATLERLSHCERLKTLSIISARVTDAGLRYLERLPQLESLMLADAPITLEGLRHLRTCPRLRTLQIPKRPLGADDIDQLRQFKRLKYLLIDRRQQPEALVEELKRAIPNTRIQLY